ncbi:hypothetical protein J6590_037814 [Homalodisca vitripennis]|nr:hypothetical protein J6590_037814 [Homalodisca vitripennis]
MDHSLCLMMRFVNPFPDSLFGLNYSCLSGFQVYEVRSCQPPEAVSHPRPRPATSDPTAADCGPPLPRQEGSFFPLCLAINRSIPRRRQPTLRLPQDNRAWLLLGWVTLSVPVLASSPPVQSLVNGGGSEVTSKPLVSKLQDREGLLALNW